MTPPPSLPDRSWLLPVAVGMAGLVLLLVVAAVAWQGAWGAGALGAGRADGDRRPRAPRRGGTGFGERAGAVRQIPSHLPAGSGRVTGGRNPPGGVVVWGAGLKAPTGSSLVSPRGAGRPRG